MKPSNTAGFTIIESVLFLGISGLLAMAVLVGTGTSINIQRYRDSVVSLQSTLQEQYSKVSSIRNTRGTDWTCNSSSITSQTLPGNGLGLGQSDCAILGRFITTTDSKTLLITDVVGYTPLASTSGKSDIDALIDYKIRLSTVASDSYELEWGASIVGAGNNKGLVFSILILRSPNSGTIHTFIDDSNSTNNVTGLLLASALTKPVKLCVNSNGLFTGNKMAVFIKANSSSVSGVETLGDNSGC
jgi:type II secretory pathway pseudopilin PulG